MNTEIRVGVLNRNILGLYNITSERQMPADLRERQSAPIVPCASFATFCGLRRSDPCLGAARLESRWVRQSLDSETAFGHRTIRERSEWGSRQSAVQSRRATLTLPVPTSSWPCELPERSKLAAPESDSCEPKSVDKNKAGKCG